MRKHLLILAMAASIAAACDSKSEYETRDVKIDMEVVQLSAGFASVKFTPSKPAYYLTSFDKCIPGINPNEYKEYFKTLALDSLYIDYMQWRHDKMMIGCEYIADFASHSLRYGQATISQYCLQPDTDYWVYCFVVDPEINMAKGDLFIDVIHTKKESIYSDISFNYRVLGYWDYVYPYSMTTKVLNNEVPWVGETADSLDIRALGFSSPGQYFDHRFNSLGFSDRILTGIYAHENNGAGDGTSSTEFKAGHTYYTAIATFDGKRNDCFEIYRFRWNGPDTKYDLSHKDSTGGAW